jgi:hypothetical protein
MKILMLQSKGEHAENWQFKEGLCYAFKRANINCQLWGFGQLNFGQRFEDIVNQFDVVLVLEDYDSRNWLPYLGNLKKLKLFWSMDSHLCFERHLNFAKTNKIDVLLTSVHDSVDKFKNSGMTNTYLFPNAYSKDLIMYQNLPKIYNVGFCGNYQNRSYL